jgi:thioredoxin 1
MKLTIIDVWAEWCAPCIKFAPIFEALQEAYPEIDFIKINADENPDFLHKYRIQAIPTIMFIKGGEVVFAHRGILTRANMDNLISTYSKV